MPVRDVITVAPTCPTHELAAWERVTRAAVDAERRRIACELHDILARALTVMVLQAAGARRVGAQDLAVVDAALAAVVETGTSAVRDLRALLEGVRSGGCGPVGLAAVPALVAGTTSAGMPTTLHTAGAARPLDPPLDHVAFLVVQESLTNALKHAGRPGSATVRLDWDDDRLRIDVRDRPRPSGTDPGPTLSAGFGLVGLRERVAAVGGTLAAGPHGDGYLVRAALPG